MTGDEQGFWRWLTTVARPYVGWLLIVVAAVLIFLCWYGVSGQTDPGQQLPYFASDGLAAIALVIVGAALIASSPSGGHAHQDETARKVNDLYALLTDDGETPPAPAASTDSVVALPTGTSYHRPTCALVAGKPAVAVDAKTIAARSLKPCRVCEPGG